MSVEDKAKELLSKMDVKHHQKFGYGSSFPVSMYDSQIKKCALICVDEIIKSLYKLPSLNDIVDSRQAGGYWEEVKQEIEKL